MTTPVIYGQPIDVSIFLFVDRAIDVSNGWRTRDMASAPAHVDSRGDVSPIDDVIAHAGLRHSGFWSRRPTRTRSEAPLRPVPEMTKQISGATCGRRTTARWRNDVVLLFKLSSRNRFGVRELTCFANGLLR
jgi:hypothetical protein